MLSQHVDYYVEALILYFPYAISSSVRPLLSLVVNFFVLLSGCSIQRTPSLCIKSPSMGELIFNIKLVWGGEYAF